MPGPTFALHKDHTDHFRRSGADALLSLGKYLLELEDGWRRRAAAPQDAVAADLQRLLIAVQEHFDKSPRSWLRQFLIDPSTKKVDARAARVLAFLGAIHVFKGERSADVMRVAAACALGGSAAERLEARRVIASLGVEGAVSSEGEGAFLGSVRVSPPFMAYLLGGAQCGPMVLSDDAFFSALSDRKRQHACLSSGRRKADGATERTDSKAFVAEFVRDFPCLTPKELFDELGRRGYVGQEDARRRMSLAAYRHLRRLKQVYVDGVPAGSLPRENILLRGPTGSGKTHLATTLFGGILKLPTVTLDMTTFTESGYVGEDVLAGILPRLIAVCGVRLGELGIIVMDEIDKLADAGIEGGRTMVSRHGVQRSLLKLLEPGVVEVPSEYGGNPMRCRRVPFDTTNVLWIGCGAFSSFGKIAGRKRALGFGADAGVETTHAESAGAAGMSTLGILPELYGRFAIEIELEPLRAPEMKEILARNVIEQYRRELAAGGVALLVEDSAVDVLVERAVARGTGARGLQAEMVTCLQDAAFEVYSVVEKDRLVRLYGSSGGVRWEIGKRSATKVTFGEIASIVGQDEAVVPA